MNRSDTTFLVLAVCVALIFSALTLTHVCGLLDESGVPATGAAGVSRDVDMGKLEGMIRRRELSDHEALFYGPVTAGEAPEAAEEDAGEDEEGVVSP